MTDSSDDGKIPCEHPGCEARAKPGMGMAAHVTRAHKTKPANGDADAIFLKVAEATKILVPDPDDLYLRMEEVVELRKAMIRFLSR